MASITNESIPRGAPGAAPTDERKPLFVLPEGGVDLADVERSLVEQALEKAHGNQSKAARMLGISRFALRSRIERHQLRDKVSGSS